MRLLIILLLLTGCTQGVMIESHSLPKAEVIEVCTEITGVDGAIGCWIGPWDGEGKDTGNRHQIWFPEGDYCVAGHEVRHVYEDYWHKGKKYQCAKLQTNP